jgi:hypothetical protein
MYYEINVSLNGRHFFATAKRSITSQSDLKKVYPVIKAKFPEEEGFTIMVSEHPEMSVYLNTDELEVQK